MNKTVVILTIFIIAITAVIAMIFSIIKSNVENISSNWIKYSGNPVLGDESTGSLFDPNVIIDSDGIYRMYVSWRDKGAIAVTTSTDGINWSPMKIVLDKDLTTGWENIVNRATVIYKDNKYHMWYTGQSNNISKIGYAISDDGYTFQKIKENPVLIPEKEWEKDSVMNPYVMYDEQENIYKMWYAAGETYEPNVIAYAISTNGIDWRKYANNPIFEANNDKEALDGYKVGACEIYKSKEDEYIMFYIGYTDINTARIFIAKSKNGITDWQRYGNNPIIVPSKGSFDENACYKPTVIYDNKNDRWMLWYNGRKENEENKNNKEYIGLCICNEFY